MRVLGIGPAGPLGLEHPLGRARVAETSGWLPTEPARTGGPLPGPDSGSAQSGDAVRQPHDLAAGHAGALDTDERDALIVLVTVDGLGPATLGRMLAAMGGAVPVLRAAAAPGAVAILSEAALDNERRSGLGAEVAARLVAAAGDAGRIMDRIRAAGVHPVTLADADYPDRLRSIALPPHVLFVNGDPAALSADRSVAVVGTRHPTEPGRRLAAQIGSAIARCDATVVSGLALGIDGAAHAAVVAEGGHTVAVLGGGHRVLYPRAHHRLADAIATGGGAVISEFAPDVAPTPGTFPRRNRLISGLTEATVVIEAGIRSGALTTAAWALEQGRGCYLVPGPVDAPMSAGCLAFLRECAGEARIVAGIPQLLEDLGLVPPASVSRQTELARTASRRPGEARVRDRARPRGPAAEAAIGALGGTERGIATALVAGLGTADELVAALDLPIASVLGALTLLEMRGLVVAAYGRYQPAGPLAGATPTATAASSARLLRPTGTLPAGLQSVVTSAAERGPDPA